MANGPNESGVRASFEDGQAVFRDGDEVYRMSIQDYELLCAHYGLDPETARFNFSALRGPGYTGVVRL